MNSQVLLVIDCTHVAIAAPATIDPEFPESIYVNRKNYHSLNVQLICDDNLKILNINAGSTHDAHIWGQSQISEIMETVYRRDPRNPLFLLGDSGYSLRPWLLSPLPDVHPNTPEQRCNDRFKFIRSLIERCNGVLKNRFRYLLKHRVLHYEPNKAGVIINACSVLHNMCIENNIREPDVNFEDIDFGMYEAVANTENQDVLRRLIPDLLAARRLQQYIINNNFN